MPYNFSILNIFIYKEENDMTFYADIDTNDNMQDTNPTQNSSKINLVCSICANLFFLILTAVGVIFTIKVFNGIGNPYLFSDISASKSLLSSFIIFFIWTSILFMTGKILFKEIYNCSITTIFQRQSRINDNFQYFFQYSLIAYLCGIFSTLASAFSALFFFGNLIYRAFVFLTDSVQLIVFINYLINDVNFVWILWSLAFLGAGLSAICSKCQESKINAH